MNVETSRMLQPCIEELIILVGNLCVQHAENTATVRFGLSNPFLKGLVTLPFEYFLHPSKQNILLPTLIILCIDDSNRLIMEDEISLKFLGMYISSIKEKNNDWRMDFDLRISPQYLQDCKGLFE